MKKAAFPIEIKRGSASVKIYKIPCRGSDCFTISHWLHGARNRVTYGTDGDAKTEAAAATQLTNPTSATGPVFEKVSVVQFS